MQIAELPTKRGTAGDHAVQRPTAWLEISITTDTSSPAQKVAFIAATLAE